MMLESELHAIRRRAEQCRDKWMDTHPGVQVPPTQGIDTLRLLDWIEKADAPEEDIWDDCVEGVE